MEDLNRSFQTRNLLIRTIKPLMVGSQIINNHSLTHRMSLEHWARPGFLREIVPAERPNLNLRSRNKTPLMKTKEGPMKLSASPKCQGKALATSSNLNIRHYNLRSNKCLRSLKASKIQVSHNLIKTASKTRSNLLSQLWHSSTSNRLLSSSNNSRTVRVLEPPKGSRVARQGEKLSRSRAISTSRSRWDFREINLHLLVATAPQRQETQMDKLNHPKEWAQAFHQVTESKAQDRAIEWNQLTPQHIVDQPADHSREQSRQSRPRSCIRVLTWTKTMDEACQLARLMATWTLQEQEITPRVFQTSTRRDLSAIIQMWI